MTKNVISGTKNGIREIRILLLKQKNSYLVVILIKKSVYKMSIDENYTLARCLLIGKSNESFNKIYSFLLGTKNEIHENDPTRTSWFYPD
jgi:hypothetical protein